jgi:Ca2+/H+ antiporter
LNVVLALIVVGIGLWLIDTYIPMAGAIKSILNIVVVVATCVFVLQALGLWNQVVRIEEKVSQKVTTSMDQPADHSDQSKATAPAPQSTTATEKDTVLR